MKEQQFKDLYHIYRNLKEQDRSLREINVFERAIVWEMAQSYTRYGLEAQNLLTWIYGKSEAMPIPPLPAEWSNLQHGSKQSIENLEVPFSRLYPNPSREVAYLEYNLPKDAIGILQIFNTNGQLLLSRSMSSRGKLSIPLHDLSSGIYFYRLSINDKVFSRNKLMIVH